MPQITIDTLLLSLYHSLLNPILALLPPLTLAARSPTWHTIPIYTAALYTLSVLSLRLFFAIDAQLAPGSRPRPLNWKDEIVLITGGDGGLGSIVAQVYGMRGVPVAVVDIKPETEQRVSEWEAKGCRYFNCDVGAREQVALLKRRVLDEMGAPTILINNAAIVTAKPFLELSSEDVDRTFDINVKGAIMLTQAFLPGMLARSAGGTVVNVSSVLGYLGCASLSAYTSTKAALTALHRSLAGELPLSHPGNNVRLVLLTPGQLSTPLFAQVRAPSDFFGPVVEASELAQHMIAAIDSAVSAEVSVPIYARWIHWLFVLPRGLSEGVLRRLAGLDRVAWESFVQRRY